MQKVKGMDEPMVEDILREINRSVWTIGYTGQSPERLKAHMKNMHVFDVKTLKAKGGKDKETGYDFAGDYFGLPWPCYGTPDSSTPARPTCTTPPSTSWTAGGDFRANFGVERNGENLLARRRLRTRWARTSPLATPSSTTCSSRSWAGGTT